MTTLSNQLREAAGKATPGPWEIAKYGVGQRVVAPSLLGFNGPFRIADAHLTADLANTARAPEAAANAAFIALANPANILALLDRLERCEKALTPFAMRVPASGLKQTDGTLVALAGIEVEHFRAAVAALKED